MCCLRRNECPETRAKTRKGRQPSITNPGHSGPTTFFLKTEKEMERSMQRGRKPSRASAVPEEDDQTTPMASVEDTSFGVQSLEETINSTFSSTGSLSRTASTSTERSSEADADGNLTIGRRRPANRVHPTIMAAGQRIISSERPHTQAASGASPELFASPLRNPHLRRGSGTSSINMSHPLTPIKLSPHQQSATPSEPRSGSPKSFRLSDEESSVVDDASSQVVFSSGGEEDDLRQVERTPQLVMPSLAMPGRKPFTELGRQLGRAKIMVIGPKGVGKSSFINSVLRSSEHIVHVDPAVVGPSTHPSYNGDDDNCRPVFSELHASTRPLPSWWTDFESRRMLHRRKSIGEGALDRNLTFIDTRGLDDDRDIQRLLEYVKSDMQRTARLDSMGDSELVNLLSGDGGAQIDAIIYLFDPNPKDGSDPVQCGLTEKHQELVRHLCKWNNFIPVIGRADTVTAEALEMRKNQIHELLGSMSVESYALAESNEANTSRLEPFAVSSALGDDTEVIDASILMSSQYMQPLLPSELGSFLELFLTPDNISKMRHLSAIKFVLWRQGNLGYHVGRSLSLRASSPGDLSLGSVEPSKVLVPHSTSSYYRADSPAYSDNSRLSANAAEIATLPRYNEQPSEPFRQVRLAKWAQDLQRSLANERGRYVQMFNNRTTVRSSGSSEKDDQALTTTTNDCRPGRGRLGGDLGVIDPRDPLGVLAFGQAFRRRGYFMLQIVGSCGLIGAVAYWIMRNWAEVQDFFGVGQTSMVQATAVPAPSPKTWLDTIDLRSFFGWR
ncbi:hypothetical protein M409DRAFT_69560 [Zasmidium cellare ATCC 36951]|uniref:Septin-type G domain-containing protein n=1 Tax=Zasmidium cellare ATCC 36951 TaxID=1080233 RepID=A0A6A6C406_ZASCE|nr:uncharacterized protein M409DRAFT_69560 [Zasmidium cellare ATCC 36951]KAF2161755.1 hypothetical protein M409DRAFT_69560 [Zasmidium cellare ATCC 36951]